MNQAALTSGIRSRDTGIGAATGDSTTNCIARDIRTAHRRRWPNKPVRLVTSTWLLASSPVLQLLLIHRWVRRLDTLRKQGGRIGWMANTGLAALMLPKWITQIRAKCELNKEMALDGGVNFSEHGNIFFGAIQAGTGLVVGSRVTAGSSHVDGGMPRIGRNVWIGSDCVLYGSINIGDGATLLPGTVLTKSIPAGVVMQGNPARLVRKNFDNTALRALSDKQSLDYVTSLQGG